MSTVFPLATDPALVMAAGFVFDAADRRLIDDQIRAIMATGRTAWLGGTQATYLPVSGSSGAIAIGDWLVLETTSAGVVSVTRATSAALTAAGGGIFGVALAAASPGASSVLVALAGAVPASALGVTAASTTLYLNTTTARASTTPSLYRLGTTDARGTLALGGATSAVTTSGPSPLDVIAPLTITGATSSTNVDTLALALPADLLMSALIVKVTQAMVGAGGVVLSAGTSAGGQQFLLNQSITSATAVGTRYGIATAQLGASFDSAKSYNAELLSGSSIYVRLACTAVISTPLIVQARIFGAYV